MNGRRGRSAAPLLAAMPPLSIISPRVSVTGDLFQPIRRSSAGITPNQDALVTGGASIAGLQCIDAERGKDREARQTGTE